MSTPILGDDPSRRILGAGGLLLVALLAALPFLPALQGEFLYWDDEELFLLNSEFRGLSLTHLRWMSTTFLMGHYHPLTWLSHAIDYRLGGTDPFWYHCNNLVLHAANAALVAILIRALLRKTLARLPDARVLYFACAVGALFFAVHPLRAESVAWVTERRDVLSTFFYLLTLITYLRRGDTVGSARRSALVLPLLFFLLSLLSKAWAVTLPAVLLIIDVYPLRRIRSGTPWRPEALRMIFEKLPFFALSAVFGALAILAQSSSAALIVVGDHGLLDRIMQAAYGLCFYVGKTLFPTSLSPLYLLKNSFEPTDALYLACASIVLATGLAALILRKRHPWVWASLASYAVVVFPVLGIAQSGDQLTADRYSYISCLPFAVWVAAGVARIANSRLDGTRTLPGWLVPLVALGLLAAPSLTTYHQTRIWRNTKTLWSHVLRVDPDNYVAHNFRGNYYARTDAADKALVDYAAALALEPDYALAYYNRGVLRLALGETSGALADFEASIRLDPASPQGYLNRGALLHQSGDFQRALSDFDKAIALSPADPVLFKNRGLSRHGLADFPGALADFDSALALRPRYAEALSARAVSRAGLGDHAGARRDYDEALAIDPALTAAYNNRGNLLREQDDLAGARADFDAAIRSDANSFEAYVNRGSLRLAQGDSQGAVVDLEAALARAPAGWPLRARVLDVLQHARGTSEAGAR